MKRWLSIYEQECTYTISINLYDKKIYTYISYYSLNNTDLTTKFNYTRLHSLPPPPSFHEHEHVLTRSCVLNLIDTFKIAAEESKEGEVTLQIGSWYMQNRALDRYRSTERLQNILWSRALSRLAFPRVYDIPVDVGGSTARVFREYYTITFSRAIRLAAKECRRELVSRGMLVYWFYNDHYRNQMQLLHARSFHVCAFYECRLQFEIFSSRIRRIETSGISLYRRKDVACKSQEYIVYEE